MAWRSLRIVVQLLTGSVCIIEGHVDAAQFLCLLHCWARHSSLAVEISLWELAVHVFDSSVGDWEIVSACAESAWVRL